MLNALLRPMGWWMHKGFRDSDNRFEFRWFFHRKDEIVAAKRKLGAKWLLQGFNIELYLFPKRHQRLAASFTIQHDCEGTLKWNFALPFLFSAWLSVDCGYPSWAKRICGEYKGREFGFYANEDGFSFKFWADTNAWSRRVSDTGIQYYFSWDKLKGKVTHVHEVFESHIVTFEQPAYKSRPATQHECTLTLERRTWSFRNPFCKTIVNNYWEVSFKDGQKPPAFSGKGENSWDGGDDGIYGIGFPIDKVGATYDGAIQAYIVKVIENRKRYG